MVEIDRIRDLVAMMKEHELSELELRDGDQVIVIKRGAGPVVIPQPVPVAPHAAAAPAGASVAGAAGDHLAEAVDDGLLTIRSPMVGMFYAGPDPDSPPFVTPGSLVEPDTIVCIIEAMKVFNEIKADVAGTIEQVLVRNEQPVEYGQALFTVRPRR